MSAAEIPLAPLAPAQSTSCSGSAIRSIFLYQQPESRRVIRDHDFTDIILKIIPKRAPAAFSDPYPESPSPVPPYPLKLAQSK